MTLRILLRSSWQAVNIGDIAHTPGALALLRRHLPDAEVTLWPQDLSLGVQELLLRSFPGLRLAVGDIDADGRPLSADLADAFARCDVLVHGSGPGLVGHQALLAWRRQTGKPYGVFGITMDPHGFAAGGVLEGSTLEEARSRLTGPGSPALDQGVRDLIAGSAFWFLRETWSRDWLLAQGVLAAQVAFGPDATTACTLRDDRLAATFLERHELEPGRFLCVVPRLRYSPYHLIHHRAATDLDRRKDAYNALHVDRDHALLRSAIIAWVRQTGLRVLACPEMTYEMALAKEQLIDPLPADVTSQVVWRDTYWLPDEAAAVYARARCVLSLECHSPLLALALGVPAIHLRQPTDTIKGQMYRDLGMDAWFGEIDATTPEDLWHRLETIHRDHPAALAQAAAIRDRAAGLQRSMVEAVGRAVGERREHRNVVG